MDPDRAYGQAELLKAFAHPTRLQILGELQKGTRCVTDMEDILPVTQVNISQHLTLYLEPVITIDSVCVSNLPPVSKTTSREMRCASSINSRLTSDVMLKGRSCEPPVPCARKPESCSLRTIPLKVSASLVAYVIAKWAFLPHAANRLGASGPAATAGFF